MSVHDPLLKRLIRRAYQAGHGQLYEKSTEEVRDHLLKLVPPQTQHYPFEEHHIAENIHFRIYRATQAQGSLFFVRASAFTGGGLMDETNAMCAMLAERLNFDVVSLNFRMPPHYRFPVFFEDVVATTQWINENHQSLNLKKPFYSWGESSGGTMVASLNQYLAELNQPLFEKQILLYPMMDLVTDYPSKQDYGYGYMLDMNMIEWLIERVMNHRGEIGDFRISPGQHKAVKQPTTILLTCEFDPLRDEGNAYAQNLTEHGAKVYHKCMPGMVHGFVRYYEKLEPAKQALDWVQACLQD